jgi:2-keto-3-deoxy-L-arabinonate dehydratase
VTCQELHLKGVIPILSMPFTDDEAVDQEALGSEIDFLVDAGVDAMGFGFGSEILRLTDAERDGAVRAASAQLGGRCELIVSVGGGSVAALFQRARDAQHAGATVLMVTPPGGAAATLTTCQEAFAALESEIGLPMIIQDAPSMTGLVMPPQFLASLTDRLKLVTALKIEAIPSAPKLGEVTDLVGDRVSVLGGAGGGDFFHELARGATGTMPGAGLPGAFTDVWTLFRAGNVAGARAQFNSMLPLLTLSLRSLDTFLYVQKELLRRAGVIPSARLRRPSERFDSKFRQELDVAITDLDRARA